MKKCTSLLAVISRNQIIRFSGKWLLIEALVASAAVYYLRTTCHMSDDLTKAVAVPILVLSVMIVVTVIDIIGAIYTSVWKFFLSHGYDQSDQSLNS